MSDDDRLVESVRQQLDARGVAHIRTGDRRSVAAAKRIAKAADPDAKATKRDGFVEVTRT